MLVCGLPLRVPFPVNVSVLLGSPCGGVAQISLEQRHHRDPGTAFRQYSRVAEPVRTRLVSLRWTCHQMPCVGECAPPHQPLSACPRHRCAVRCDREASLTHLLCARAGLWFASAGAFPCQCLRFTWLLPMWWGRADIFTTTPSPRSRTIFSPTRRSCRTCKDPPCVSPMDLPPNAMCRRVCYAQPTLISLSAAPLLGAV